LGPVVLVCGDTGVDLLDDTDLEEESGCLSKAPAAPCANLPSLLSAISSIKSKKEDSLSPPTSSISDAAAL